VGDVFATLFLLFSELPVPSLQLSNMGCAKTIGAGRETGKYGNSPVITQGHVTVTTNPDEGLTGGEMSLSRLRWFPSLTRPRDEDGERGRGGNTKQPSGGGVTNSSVGRGRRRDGHAWAFEPKGWWYTPNQNEYYPIKLGARLIGKEMERRGLPYSKPARGRQNPLAHQAT